MFGKFGLDFDVVNDFEFYYIVVMYVWVYFFVEDVFYNCFKCFVMVNRVFESLILVSEERRFVILDEFYGIFYVF